ncbi:hypothetical protein C9I28_13660 [Pseudoduganella armeniaca]|uniref:Uncharacterized protein n=2 Tax=Pseudoduganella armeniaca TaxID=2072590 RepID=A0A2R4CAK0_9BURK|nr:hypothetical protein C9I28_13660 [Pseudoduganella armeniaca]
MGGLLGIGAVRETSTALADQQASLRQTLTSAQAVVPKAAGSTLSLPGPDSLALISATIPALLQRYEVGLIDVAFSPTRAHGKVGRSTQVVLRLRGTYGNVKGALQALLVNHTGVALQSLSFRRSKSTDPTVDAEVRLDVFYREQQ